MFPGLFHSQFSYLVHDPVEVFLAHGIYIRIGSRIHKVDGVRDAILAGKFHRVQVVAQRATQGQAIPFYPIESLASTGAGFFT